MFSTTMFLFSFREREAVKLCSSHKSFPCFHTCKITPVGLWSHVYRVCGLIHVRYRPEVISRHEYMHFKVPENVQHLNPGRFIQMQIGCNGILTRGGEIKLLSSSMPFHLLLPFAFFLV